VVVIASGTMETSEDRTPLMVSKEEEVKAHCTDHFRWTREEITTRMP